MDKHLKIGLDRIPDSPDFIQGQLTGEYKAGETAIFKETGFFRVARVALGGGMQCQWRQSLHAGQRQVLDDDSVNIGFP